MNGDPLGMHNFAESMLDDTKRACDALLDKAQKSSFALLDDTKVKCDKMIDEAGDEALKIMKQKLRAWSALFACIVVALSATSFALGYFTGKG
jgi:hypothetical protein